MRVPDQQTRLRQSRGSKFQRELRSRKTPSELHIENLLQKLNIRYQDQKVFYADEMLVLADFYLPKPYKIVIEVDGEYHENPKQKWRDYYKDRYYEKRGFSVLRITNQIALLCDEEQLLRLITTCD